MYAYTHTHSLSHSRTHMYTHISHALHALYTHHAQAILSRTCTRMHSPCIINVVVIYLFIYLLQKDVIINPHRVMFMTKARTELIRDYYKPLHPEIFTLSDAVFVPSFLGIILAHITPHSLSVANTYTCFFFSLLLF